MQYAQLHKPRMPQHCTVLAPIGGACVNKQARLDLEDS